MFHLKLKEKQNEEGFTLIELLVVVIIIGILAAIAIPVFLNQRQNAWRGAGESDVRNVAIEVESYFTQHDEYPSDDLSEIAGNIRWSASMDGTTAELHATAASFVLCAQSESLDDAGVTESWISYDSNAGGVQDWAAIGDVPCT